jgi:uncharacterized protein YbbK (DUF523 family)
MKKIAVSACLLGQRCKYNGESNFDSSIKAYIDGLNMEVVSFCPEDSAFGTPRPTMDLVQIDERVEAICNTTGKVLTSPIKAYAMKFFDRHGDIEYFVGKSKSPSCGVGSAKLYDQDRELISNQDSGIMAREAKKRNIRVLDSNDLKEYNE